jgi:peptidase MA superfamily protein
VARRFFKFLVAIFSIVAFITVAAGCCAASPSADSLFKHNGFFWKSVFTKHLRLHFEPGTFAENRIEYLKLSEEKAFARNLDLLETKTYPLQIDVFVLASRERMKQLLGRETNGIAFPETKVVCFILNEKVNASEAHELMHVMAKHVWQGKPKTWLNEGLATYADDLWYGYRLHNLNKYLLQQGKLIPLEKLIEHFGESSVMITYPQAGSFVKYLYEQYGADKVRDLWSSGTARDLKRVLGKDMATLETEWHIKLMEVDASGVRYEFSPSK